MTVIEKVVQKLTELAPNSQLEVLDFVEFLAQKSSGNPEESRAGQGADVSPVFGGSGKSKAEIFLELAKLSEQSLEKRKDVEWKVNLAFWSGIAVFTWFGAQHLCPMDNEWLLGFGVAYLVALGIWVGGWQIPLHGAHETDRLFKHFYAEIAEGMTSIRPKGLTFLERWHKVKSQPWFWGQVLMTAVLFILSFMVLAKSKGSEEPPPNGDVLRVSGKNLEVILDTLPYLRGQGSY